MVLHLLNIQSPLFNLPVSHLHNIQSPTCLTGGSALLNIWSATWQRLENLMYNVDHHDVRQKLSETLRTFEITVFEIEQMAHDASEGPRCCSLFDRLSTYSYFRSLLTSFISVILNIYMVWLLKVTPPNEFAARPYYDILVIITH